MHLGATLLLALGMQAGCPGESIPDDQGEKGPLKAIRVEPLAATLTLADGKIQQQPYRAFGYHGTAPAGLTQKGARPPGGEEITGKVTWGLDVPTLGRFSGATLRTEILSGGKAAPARHGGKAVVTATLGAVSGRADLSVIFRKSIYQGVPPGTESKFSNKKTDPGRALKIIYPESGVLLPPNMDYLDLQWTRGSNDLFEVRVSNALLDLRVYTKAASHVLSKENWTALARAARDGQATAQVRGTTGANPAAVGVSGTVTLKLAKEDITAGLYYWETSDQGGVFRYDFQHPQPQAVAYYTRNEDGSCVGCHAISRAGDRMAFIRRGMDGWSGILDVKKRTITVSNQYQGNIQTFSPQSAEVIVGYKGKLERRDAATGKLLGALPTGPGKAVNPDWSADGKSVVFVSVPDSDYTNNQFFESGSIKVISRAASGAGWTQPRLLVAGKGKLTNYYPSFGPRGEWVVFNRSLTGDCYAAQDANIFVVRASGGKVLPLSRINGSKLSNSWPRWSPLEQTHEGQKLYWLTFSSTRDYGAKLLNSKKPELKEFPQLWMAAFRPALAAQGKDPASPPFWLHFQKIDKHNHIAQWAEKIVK